MRFLRQEFLLYIQVFWIWLFCYYSATNADQCAGTGQVCPQNATCKTLKLSSSCVCKTGFTGNGTICTDFDECALTMGICHENASCVNTIGSYACFCNGGYTGDGFSCTTISINRTLPETTASTHATNSNVNSSVNHNVTSGKNNGTMKCSSDSSCHVNASCHSVGHSTYCTCDPGFTGNGVNCSDVDECRESLSTCGANAHCVNTIGSYLCACDSGLYYIGKECVPADPCALEQNQICDPNARCGPAGNTYRCFCKEGYTGNGLTCEDVDECMLERYQCDTNSTCKNTAGSYLCCQDGESCQDVSSSTDVQQGGVFVDHSTDYRGLMKKQKDQDSKALIWGLPIGTTIVVVFVILLGAMGYRRRRMLLSGRMTRHPSTIIGQIEVILMEEQRMRESVGDSWSLKSVIFSIPSASPSLQTLNEGDSHTNMLRKSSLRV